MLYGLHKDPKDLLLLAPVQPVLLGLLEDIVRPELLPTQFSSSVPRPVHLDFSPAASSSKLRPVTMSGHEDPRDDTVDLVAGNAPVLNRLPLLVGFEESGLRHKGEAFSIHCRLLDQPNRLLIFGEVVHLDPVT